jgi:hypothetical protein
MKKANSQQNSQMTLSSSDLSKRWKMSVGTLANWRNQKTGPSFLKLGSRVVYKLKDVEKFELKNKVSV